MLTGRPKRACLCREVPTEHEAHGQTQRWLQNSKNFGGSAPRTPKQSPRMLKPFARARNDVEANQSCCALRSHTFTRSARRERTVVLFSPADHAQHVKERAVHENVTQGVMDSPQQHRRDVSRLSKRGRVGGSDDPRDEKTKERTHSGRE